MRLSQATRGGDLRPGRDISRRKHLSNIISSRPFYQSHLRHLKSPEPQRKPSRPSQQARGRIYNHEVHQYYDGTITILRGRLGNKIPQMAIKISLQRHEVHVLCYKASLDTWGRGSLLDGALKSNTPI